jgi:RHS repeat-associated protein
LTQEQLSIEYLSGSGTNWTDSLTYDNGVAAGPGILTQMGDPNPNLGDWTGGVSPFSRVNTETNTSTSYSAYGHVNGQSTLTALLDGEPVTVTTVGTNDAHEWNAQLQLTPGAHQLVVKALNWSGFYTASATNTFTNNNAHETATIERDGSGNIEQRIWSDTNGTILLNQQLYWDAKDRLSQVTEVDGQGNGFLLLAEYDGLDRRLLTQYYVTSNWWTQVEGVTPLTINQYYDPQVEFLELGVSVNNQTTWKLYGPDLNGKYGGLNGTGGLDGVSPYLSEFNPVISDSRGNILAEVTNGIVVWNSARPTGYGAMPGYQPVALGHGADVAQASAWRGRWMDISGHYNIGKRPYDSIAGMWLSYDPIWNERDPNYLTFCGGDPINSFDPDGRCANPAGQQNGVTAANIFGANGGNVNVNSLLAWGAQNPNANVTGTDNASGWIAAGQAMANGTMPNPQYINGYTDEFGHNSMTFCYSCHDPNDQFAQLKLGAAFNTVNTSIPAFLAQNALAFVPAEGMVGDVAPIVNYLTQGVDYEAQRLTALNLPKNTTVFQPTADQVQSAAFQVIVGPPQYTAGGQLVGTISDSTAGGLTEIKGGSSVLNSSYQLRLQTYNSVVNNVPLTIETTRPVNPTFMNYLQNWGVTVKPPGTP